MSILLRMKVCPKWSRNNPCASRSNHPSLPSVLEQLESQARCGEGIMEERQRKKSCVETEKQTHLIRNILDQKFFTKIT